MRAFLPLVVLPLLGGCAARATYFMITAERAYQAAAADDTDELAPYEMTLAAEYLAKAQEKVGTNGFQDAEELAKASQAYVSKAIEVAGQRRLEKENTEEFVPEERVEKAPEDKTKIDIDLDDP